MRAEALRYARLVGHSCVHLVTTAGVGGIDGQTGGQLDPLPKVQDPFVAEAADGQLHLIFALERLKFIQSAG